MKQMLSKKKWLVVTFLIVLSYFFVPVTAKASGLVEFNQNSQYLYSTYDLGNYDLDFYVDSSWSWLPWNWMDAIGRQVMYGLYCLTNTIWYLSRLISSATGAVVAEAYRFDLINEVADSIGSNMQHLAGVSTSGISSDGFYAGFLPWVVLVLGVYVTYKGLFKRQFTAAMGAAVKTVVIFLFSAALIVYAPTCIRDVNEFSTDISTAALNLGMGVVMPGAEHGDGDSVDLIRDNLFSIQVYQPWLLMEWGTTDTGAIGSDRVSAVLTVSPDGNYGTDRETAVKNEVETYGNMRMSVLKVVARFGEVIFIINLVISAFVMLLSGMLVLTQILFIVYVMFLSVSFVLAMFPGCESLLRKSLIKVFNMLMLRVGYTLLITVAFTISTVIYGLSGGHAFVTIGFLQIVVFVGIFFAKRDILGMVSVPEDGGTRRVGSLLGGALIYRGLRQGSRRLNRALPLPVRTAGGTVEKMTQKPRKVVRDKVSIAKERTDGAIDRKLDGLKGTDKETVERKQRAAEAVRRHQERDYTMSDYMPREIGAKFHGRSGAGDKVTSLNVYDRYMDRRKQKPYRVSHNTPGVKKADYTSNAWKVAEDKHVRPNLWADMPDKEKADKKYRRRQFDNKAADAFAWDAPGADLKDASRSVSGSKDRRMNHFSFDRKNGTASDKNKVLQGVREQRLRRASGERSVKPEAAGADSDGKDRENRVLPAVNMQHEHPERQNVSQKEYVEKKIVPQQKEDVDLHRRKTRNYKKPESQMEGVREKKKR